MTTAQHPLEVAASCKASATPLEAILQSRRLGAVHLKQRVRHLCRHLPNGLRNPVRKLLWRQPLRHMRYILPEVAFHPSSDGGWELVVRGNPSQRILSTPLAALRHTSARPAVILATGPSAGTFDWSGLADGRRSIWAVNGAPTLLATHGLCCDFLVVTDHRFGRDGAGHITLAVDQGATLLLTHEAAAGFASARSDVLRRARFHVIEKVNRWYGIATLSPAELLAANEASGRPYFLPNPPVPGVGWSHDPQAGVFTGKTVPFAALQLAVWAGAEAIEIVGMDLGGAGHSYHEDVPTVSHLQKDYQQFILPAFECMAAALAGSRVEIRNLSPTCPLPAALFCPNHPPA